MSNTDAFPIPGVTIQDELDWSATGKHYLERGSQDGLKDMTQAEGYALVTDWFSWDSVQHKVRYKQAALYVPAGGWALAPDCKSCWIYEPGYKAVRLDYVTVQKMVRKLAGL